MDKNAKGKKEKRPPVVESTPLKELEQIRVNAAGIDVGSNEIFVSVPEDRDKRPVQQFGTFTRDLSEIASWLKACGVETVAMESTGVYWIPLYEMLEAKGFEVYLVNAHQVKNVPGRKSDVMDCQWLRQLHTYGLLHASFRPEEQICALRSIVRHRENLIRYRAAHIQHMQKALELMNLKLTNVVSDITGTTGMTIIRSILEGERNPEVLAAYRNGHCKHSEEEIAKSLEGTYKAEHLFALQQAVELYDTYTRMMATCDTKLEEMYGTMSAKGHAQQEPLRGQRKQRKKNESTLDVQAELYRVSGVDLTRINGISASTAQAIISEVGFDMSKWKTEKQFSSWLRLCPDNRVSGGKLLSSGTKKTHNRATKALRLAAQSLYRNKSALGAYFRRMRSRLGAPAAITATAHKLARIAYRMLKYGEAYVEQTQEQYERKYQAHILSGLKRKASQLGYELVFQNSIDSNPQLVS